MTRILPGDIVFAHMPELTRPKGLGDARLALVTCAFHPQGLYAVRPLRWPLSAEPVIRSGEQLRLVASMLAREGVA